ncbi:MAG: 4-hydroxythreonine-4-phosphate dehydrogenase PdxA [Pseudomonadota bacterium]
MTALSARLPIALTMGEPSGIGPDLILLSWRALKAPFLCVGDPAVLIERSKLLSCPLPSIEIIENPSQAEALFGKAIPVTPIPLPGKVRAGVPNIENTAAVIESLKKAAQWACARQVRALVTAPILKAALREGGFAFAGHTDFLAAQAGGCNPVMILYAQDLCVVPATIHLPLAEVPSALSVPLLLETFCATDQFLRERLAITTPQIAVCGLNPHAGEDGWLGREEQEIIIPAIKAARHKGVSLSQPLAADGIFASNPHQWDAIIGMYHDQVLAPFKALAFDQGVNITANLPFVRTSPDHGTALSLAGTQNIDLRSFLAAFALADRLSA